MRKFTDVVQDKNGNAIVNAVVTVRIANASPGTGALAPIYSDNGTTLVGSSTVLTDSNGRYSFYAAEDRFDLIVTGTGLVTTVVADVGEGLPRLIEEDLGTYDAFGDSMTAGFAATDRSATAYVPLIAKQFGVTANNHGVGGNWLQDQANAVFSTAITNGSKSTLMAGFNDAWQGNPANPVLTTYKQQLSAMLTWLAIPDTLKLKGQSSDIVYTGTWSNQTGFGGFTKGSRTTGDIAVATVHGTTVYVAMASDVSDGGPFTVTVDGTVYPNVGSYSTTGTVTSVATGLTTSPMLVRIPKLSLGKHTVTVTVGAGANLRSIIFIAGNAGTRLANGPQVYAANVPRLSAASTLRGTGPTFWGSDANTLAFNVAFDQVIADLVSDGLNVTGADVANYWNVDNNYLTVAGVLSQVDVDGIHPNDLGHLNIANAFFEGIDGVVAPADRGASLRLKGIQLGLTSNKFVALNHTLMLGGTDDSVNSLPLIASTGNANPVQGVTPILGIGSNNIGWRLALDGGGNLGIEGALITGSTITAHNQITADGNVTSKAAIQEQTANGGQWILGQASELLTLSTAGTTTDTAANLLPANSVIEAVIARVTTTITTATDWKLGDATTSGRFAAANATMTVGATSVGTVQADQTGASGPRQTAAAKVRVTTTGTPGAGVIRITVFYRQFVAPTS